MAKYRARAGPPTLAGRLRLLNDELQALAGRLKEAIAAAVAGAAAAAVRDALRQLLGAPEPPRRAPPREAEGGLDADGWDELDEGLWPDDEESPELSPPRERDGAAGAGRAMLRAAVGAGLCWVRRLPGRRPALAAALFGAAACGAALAAGPAAAVVAGIIASTAGLLLTADAAKAAAALLGALA